MYFNFLLGNICIGLKNSFGFCIEKIRKVSDLHKKQVFKLRKKYKLLVFYLLLAFIMLGVFQKKETFNNDLGVIVL